MRNNAASFRNSVKQRKHHQDHNSWPERFHNDSNKQGAKHCWLVDYNVGSIELEHSLDWYDDN